MDHVEAEQGRDAVPVALDDQTLQSVSLDRVGDEEQRAHLAPPGGGLDRARLLGRRRGSGRTGGLIARSGQATEIEVLRQLTGFLGDRHRRHQLIHARSDRRLVAGSVSPVG